MSFRNLKRCLAAIVTSGMVFATVSSNVLAGTGDGERPSDQVVVPQGGVNLDPRIMYLSAHNISPFQYVAFVHNSGLGFEQMVDILDHDNSVDFSYLYELSTHMGNHWVSHKHQDIAQGAVFKKLLSVAKAVHLERQNIKDIEGFMNVYSISLRDLHIFVSRGFSDEQKKDLSLKDLGKLVSSLAKESTSDFFKSWFKVEGYSSYGVCSAIMESTGWTFDKFKEYLGDKLCGIHGLKCALDFSAKHGLSLTNVVDAFKRNPDIGFDDVEYLYNRVVVKGGFSCSDFVEAVDQFEGYDTKDFIAMIDSAKKSGRTYFEEFVHNFEEYEKNNKGKDVAESKK
jgi:hypothetical protein